MHYNELDPLTGYITQKNDLYDIIFDISNRQFMQLEYTRSITAIDTGVFLRSWDNYTYVSSYNIFSTFLQASFIGTYFSDPVFSTAMMSIRLQLARTDVKQ